MKDIKQFVKESILTEATGDFVVYYDHFSPSDLTIICGASKQQVKKLEDFDRIFDSVPYKKGNLYVVINDDENLTIHDTGCNNINQFKKKVLDEIKKSIENGEEDYVEIDSETACVFLEFGDGCNDHVLGGVPAGKVKPERYYEVIQNFFNESYVDNDSSSQYLLIDTKSMDALWGPSVPTIIDGAEFETWLKEWEDE